LKPASFRTLLLLLDRDQVYCDPAAEEELSPAQLEALPKVRSRRRSFLWLARLNWRPVWAGREVDLPRELQQLWAMPEGTAVDRLIGYQDGDRWRPGIAPLEPMEGRALRYRLEYRSTEDACRWLECKPSAYYKFVSEALRKLRLFMAPVQGKILGRPSAPTGLADQP
jgi:hypothetical protein